MSHSVPILTVRLLDDAAGCSMMQPICTPVDGSKGSYVRHLLNHAT